MARDVGGNFAHTGASNPTSDVTWDVTGSGSGLEIVAEGAAGGEESAVVQGRGAGDAADAVGAEELFRHGQRAGVRLRRL